MSILHLQLDSDQSYYEPGAEISGLAAWQLDKPADSVELRLCWVARGKGSPDIGTAETIALATRTQMDKSPFRFRAPQAPYSFSGKLVSVTWVLELIALPAKSSKQLDVIIAPGGKELRVLSA